MKASKIFLVGMHTIATMLLGAMIAAGIEYGFGSFWVVVGIALALVDVVCSKIALMQIENESEESDNA